MTNSIPKLDTATLAKLEEHYTPSPIPTCAVCGEALVMHGWDEARREVYRCSTRTGYRREDGGPDEYYRHYDESTFVRPQAGDTAVIALLAAYRELAAK